MKLVTFVQGKEARVGAIAGETVVDLKAAAEAQGKGPRLDMFDDMLSLLEAGDDGMQAAAAAMDGATDKSALPLEHVKLLAPVPVPRNIFCLAENYVEHIEESHSLVKEKEKITPKIFMKPSTNTAVGPGAPIIIPKVATAIDWEAELAFVIGRKGKHIAAADAFDYVAGYTAFNDVSERDLTVKEKEDPSEWEAYFDWLNGKWFDSFSPMGPCLVTKDEIPDPYDLRLTLCVNGEKMQDSKANKMIFKIDEIIEFMSKFMTLEPGDVVSTGTPSGVGESRGIFLKPGDTVRLQIEKIGVLENPVEAES